jgi:hypothetical protein
MSKTSGATFLSYWPVNTGIPKLSYSSSTKVPTLMPKMRTVIRLSSELADQDALRSPNFSSASGLTLMPEIRTVIHLSSELANQDTLKSPNFSSASGLMLMPRIRMAIPP